MKRPRLAGFVLWFLAAALTVGAFKHQDKTGPTYPLDGTIRAADGPVRFKIVRSETIGRGLPVVLLEPCPAGISGEVQYRRFSSTDAWSVEAMRRGMFEFSRRGRSTSIAGLGVVLPSLDERAGKYEILVRVADSTGRSVSVTGNRPVYARYKAAVPVWALVMHIVAIFVSMAFAVRTALQAGIGGDYRWLLGMTLVTLIIGAFVLGPLAQWYAFGVWWAGVPFGHDWTDNKVLVPLVAWAVAAYANRGGRRNPLPVYIAGVVTLAVYLIPHSIFGSEFDYRTGTGHGTVG